jgi:hypothetical protein
MTPEQEQKFIEEVEIAIEIQEKKKQTRKGLGDQFQEIPQKVPGLDLFQPRDWPHRKGVIINKYLHVDRSVFTTPPARVLVFPGDRCHPCDVCGKQIKSIHDNILCWKCKGAFCMACYGLEDNEKNCDRLSLESIVKQGFANCKKCEEPLRSIGLPTQVRTHLALKSAKQKFKNYKNGMDIRSDSRYASLVQEAEKAFSTAAKMTKKNDNERAISEYTHAINSINCMASMTSGVQLVLRARDILISSHLLRANLEGNKDLADSILLAFPRASVRDPIKGEGSYKMSKSAFGSLFYPLPAKKLAGSPCGQMMNLDQRFMGKAQALQNTDFCRQVDLLGDTLRRIRFMNE